MADEGTPTDLVSALPNAHDWLSNILGINLPHLPPLPQTIKNFDKAIARLVLATGEDLSSRLEQKVAIRKAKSTAEQAAIKATSKGYVGQIQEGGDEFDRAAQYTYGESILSQRNRENVLRLAYDKLATEETKKTGDSQEAISDDWLNTFSDLVGKKSNTDIQELWSKILAGEIRRPGSFRLKSLLSMAAIDSSDAVQINDLLSRAINDDFIFKFDQNEDLGPYMNAESLDVITVAGGMLIKKFTLHAGLNVHFVVGSVILFARSVEAKEFTIPMYKLTRFGSELCSLSSYISVDEVYVQGLIDKLKLDGLTVERANIIMKSANGISHTPICSC